MKSLSILPSLKSARQKRCHPERSLARFLRQTQSKDLRLHFGNHATNFRLRSLSSSRLSVQLIQHPLHFAQCVPVAGTCSTTDPRLEPFDRLSIPISLRQRLRRHKIPRSVVRIVLQQRVKLIERRRSLSASGHLHGHTIPCKTVFGVKGKNLPQPGNFVYQANLFRTLWLALLSSLSSICTFRRDSRNWNQALYPPSSIVPSAEILLSGLAPVSKGICQNGFQPPHIRNSALWPAPSPR
jgi:hypothetical protein